MIWENITDPHARMQRAMRKLAEKPEARFWGIIGLSMPMVPDDACERMATDGKAIFYGPTWVMTQSEAQIIGTLAHEISHPALDHFRRLKGWPVDIANMGADYELNLDLVKAGFTLPDDVLLDWRFDGMSAEQICHVVQKENDQDKRNGKSPRHVPGSGDMRQPSNDDGTPMDGQGMADLAEQWAERTAQALGAARKEGLLAGGHIPSSLESFKGHLGASHLVDWRQPLRRFIDDLGSRYATYAKLSRRGLSRGMALPGSKVIRPSLVAFYIDVSSSMDATKVNQALVEAQAALDDGACDAIELVYVNTRVLGSERFERGERISFQSATRGGTDFRDAMTFAASQDYAALVFLTDGQCDGHWGADPSCPVLWAITDTVDATNRLTPPFGEKLCLYTAR